MSITLKDFSIPEDSEKVTEIDIRNYKSLKSPEEVKGCLMACPNVKKLSIALSAYPSPTEVLNYTFGEMLSQIANYGKNIAYLNLQIPSLLDDDLRFINQENLPELREVFLPRNRSFGALGIKYIASQCPDLTTLYLSYSLYEGTDEAAFYIGKFLPNLRRLNMHRSCNLSDKGLIAIAEGCWDLEIIEVGRNYNLTDKSLKSIATHCPKLTTLAMYYNKRITEKGIAYIVEGCPKFKNFYDGGGWSKIPALQDIKLQYPDINFS